MGLLDALYNVYDKHYKKFLVLSFVLLFACFGVLVNSYMTTGEVFERGVSLKGGITLTIPVDPGQSAEKLESQLASRFPSADIAVREVTSGGVVSKLIVEAADVETDQLTSAIPELGIPLIEGEYNVREMGTRFSTAFFAQTLKSLFFAFLAMAIVVFITFRSIVPSSFVILAAVSDIIATLAVINLLEIRLSIAGAAAFLMLIGYSVDTDILLTTKVLKRKKEGGTTFERTIGAFKTGIIITAAGLSSSIIGLIFSQSETVKQIMLVITVGLAFDAIFTWFQNAGILRWYLERQEKKQQHG